MNETHLRTPRNLAAVILAVPVLLAANGRGAAAAETEGAAAALPDKDGFVSLFNGKDLTGWKTEGNWVVEDGAMVLKPRAGEDGWKRYNHYIFTEKQYGDFVLELDFKYPKGRANSGVFFRVRDLAEPVQTGIEVQMVPGHTGMLIGIKSPVPTNDHVKRLEWNHLVLTVRDNIHVVVEVNGDKVTDVESDLSKKKRVTKGYIGFQDHSYPMWYRNIRIKELDAEKSPAPTVPPRAQ